MKNFVRSQKTLYDFKIRVFFTIFKNFVRFFLLLAKSKTLYEKWRDSSFFVKYFRSSSHNYYSFSDILSCLQHFKGVVDKTMTPYYYLSPTRADLCLLYYLEMTRYPRRRAFGSQWNFGSGNQGQSRPARVQSNKISKASRLSEPQLIWTHWAYQKPC